MEEKYKQLEDDPGDQILSHIWGTFAYSDAQRIGEVSLAILHALYKRIGEAENTLFLQELGRGQDAFVYWLKKNRKKALKCGDESRYGAKFKG